LVEKPAMFDKKEAELRLYLALGRQILNTDDLHFGYWTDDLEVNIPNLPRAQENHSNFIISHIPDGTKTILDVGCGAGRMASRLWGLGYDVHGVSPSAFLADEARQVVGDDFLVFESRFEDLRTDNRYDLILFSESFQYVKMEKALENSLTLLNDSGHLLICDCFQKDTEGKSPLKAGPRLSRFYEMISQALFELVEDIDITSETAPTADLTDDIYRNIFRPVWEIVFERLRSTHPWLLKFLKCKYRKKIEKMEWRYFSGNRDGENFRKYRSYRLMLLKKTAPRA